MLVVFSDKPGTGNVAVPSVLLNSASVVTQVWLNWKPQTVERRGQVREEVLCCDLESADEHIVVLAGSLEQHRDVPAVLTTHGPPVSGSIQSSAPKPG